ncbi:hypothetical protein CRV24_008375 [Beauveria bassiana]|uniref:Uncharacterized protein n=1 Tax=Beauveria bassiana (strain ARSEF 2860) TaxID=655819 RepID=J5JWY8_BEAB2|nr:uncharacterized protein BBA_04099 [Beauveria bassiana ARSEF 2860]EJP66806.1 hypothetical protein BBA_04099 [Beauveria bassiana ARSEF 2860]KAF1732181.1 hypothetical protein CRV24_008375 [Beauveria bassiana]KAH8716449.1 hypothetical protein HC256_005221 [Beauveria bassiana]
MPVQLLPASAAAFAPRAASVNVVLGSKVEPWLTLTLKRINRVKRPLNSVAQHQRCLAETLANKNAIWTLASVMLPKLPEADMPTDYAENLFSHQLIHIEAYIVHVDMVLRNEVAYKLTTDTIDALVEFHKEIHCVDAKANSSDWSAKELQCKKLHDDFVQAINKFVFRTHVTALEGLEEDGAGELLCGKSEEVRNNLMNLMKPLIPPPPRLVEMVRQPPLLPSSPMNHIWASAVSMPPPVDAWGVFPSSPSVASSVEATTPVWHNMHMQQQVHAPSPPMDFSQPQVPSPPVDFSQPQVTNAYFFGGPQLTAPMSTVPLPSMYAPNQCGMNVYMGNVFDWQRFQDFSTPIM